MKTFKRPAAFAAIALIFASVCAAQAKYPLSFSDEFNGPRGQLPDTAKWTAEIGGEGWGNRELQYYTASAENASLDGKGRLVIRRREGRSGGGAQMLVRTVPIHFRAAHLKRQVRTALRPVRSADQAAARTGNLARVLDARQ